MSAEATFKLVTSFNYKKELERYYEGEAVLWTDPDGVTCGPGTVVGVFKAGYPFFVDKDRWKLSIIEHSTELYTNAYPTLTEIISFTEDDWDALPERLRDEISMALAYGQQCGLNSEESTFLDPPTRCEEPRNYGEEQCGQHH